MTSKDCKKIYDLAVGDNSTKKLVTYFLEYAMVIYENNYEIAEKLFAWIYEEDYKLFTESPVDCLSGLLQCEDFLKDIEMLLELENEEYKKKIKPTKRFRGGQETVKSYNGISKKKLREELKKVSSISPEGRKIRRLLNK